MKRVGANISYTQSTVDKVLIFDFYNTNIGLNCESHYDTIQVHVDSNSWRRQLETYIWRN